MDVGSGPVIRKEEFECSFTDSVRKRKIRDENPFFQIILNKVLIMISADAKANVKKEIKISGSWILKIFLPSNLKIDI